MRPVILQFWISLDGYSADPGTELYQFLTDLPEDEGDEYFVDRLRQAGTHIMGRVTYEEMAQAWPTSGSPLAAPMNEIPKVVFSRTLPSADWPESRIARGETAEEIARLREEPGGEILAHGGTSFVRSLIELDLVDQYRLWVLPAAVGQGAQLFGGLRRLLPLSLISATPFPNGQLELVYSPAGRGA